MALSKYAKIVGNYIAKQVDAYDKIQSVDLEKKLVEEAGKIVGSIPEVKFAKTVFDSNLGDTSERKMKKILAAAMTYANERGTLVLKNKTPEAIASVSDEAVSRAKTAYHVDQKNLSFSKAADFLMDMVASRVVSVTDHWVGKGLSIAAGWACKALATVYPPAAIAAPFVTKAAKYAGPIVRKAVKSGTKYVASKAKSYVSKAWSSVKSTAKSVWSSIKSSVKSLFS